MADNDITISFANEPMGANTPNQSAGAPPLGDGVEREKEDDGKLFDRLLNSMTESMTGIFDLLSGKEDGALSGLKEMASAILGGDIFGDEDDSPVQQKDKDASFTKAAKVAGLKPEDINIVDQQWILGALLVNTTLSRIEDLLKKNSKGNNAFKASPASNKSADGGGDMSAPNRRERANIKAATKTLGSVTKDLQKIIPVLMTQLELVNWTLVFTTFKNMEKLGEPLDKIVKGINEKEADIKDFSKNVKSLVGGLLLYSLGASLLGIMLPFVLLGLASAHLLNLATTPILNAVDKVAKNKNIATFEAKAGSLTLGLLAMLASMVILAIMFPFTIPALLASALLIPIIILMNVAIKLLPSPGTLAKGLVSALLLVLVMGSLSLAVFMVKSAGTDIKKTLLGLAAVGAVALGGAVIAMVLGIPFVLGLVALGTVTAMLLAGFFLAITLSLKIVGKAGQYTDAAIAALGHISKRSKDSDDGTEHPDETGILGFFSKLASWPFIKALLITIATATVMAIDGVLLLIAAVVLNKAFKEFDSISKDYFPIGTPLNKTGPGAAVIAIRHFSRFVSGKEDEKGNELLDGEPIIGWGQLLEIAPLILYGVLLKLAAFTLDSAFKEFNKFDKNTITEVGNKAKLLGDSLDSINNAFKPREEGGGKNFITWILGKVIPGGESIGDAITWLLRCLPLFSLMLYGWLLKQAAVPLQEGIEAISKVDTSGINDKKLETIGSCINGMLKPIQEFTKGVFDKSDRYENIVDAICGLVSAFPSLINVIMNLSSININNLNVGLANFAYLLSELIGTEDTRDFAAKYFKWLPGVEGSGEAATKGSLIKALSSIKDNNIKVNTSMFDQVVALMDTISPICDQVISFAQLKPAELEAGLNGVKSIIKCVQEISSQLGGGGKDGDWNMFQQIMNTAENKSQADVAKNNPIFAIVELFGKMENFKDFSKTTDLFSQGLTKIASASSVLNDESIGKFRSFADSISSLGISAGVNQIKNLVSMEDSIRNIATDFERMAGALERISQVDVRRITEAVETTNASASTVIESTAKANAVSEGMPDQNMESYVMTIASLLQFWEMNGIKQRSSNDATPEFVVPNKTVATTAGSW